MVYLFSFLLYILLKFIIEKDLKFWYIYLLRNKFQYLLKPTRISVYHQWTLNVWSCSFTDPKIEDFFLKISNTLERRPISFSIYKIKIYLHLLYIRITVIRRHQWSYLLCILFWHKIIFIYMQRMKNETHIIVND